MELDKAIKVLQEIWRNTKFEDSRKRIAIETVLTYVRDSISKDEVRKLIEEESVARQEAKKEYKPEMQVAHEYTRLTLKSLLGEWLYEWRYKRTINYG